MLEKEATVARHQTGRNSGVLHSGIYYRPGSLKAENCRAGKLAMEEFCREQGIPFDLCGKIIVAVDEEELARLEKLLERGQANGVRCERIGPERIRELEPHAAGIAAIYIPEAGIVDYAEVARRLAEIIEEQGSRIVTGASDRHPPRRESRGRRNDRRRIRRRAGGQLRRPVQRPRHAAQRRRAVGYDRAVPRRVLYAQAGGAPSGAAVDLSRARSELPVPGRPLHTADRRRASNAARTPCWPSPAKATRNTTVNLRDLAESLTYPGFWRLAAALLADRRDEMWRSFSKPAFVRALQRLVPEIESKHLDWAPGRRAGPGRESGRHRWSTTSSSTKPTASSTSRTHRRRRPRRRSTSGGWSSIGWRRGLT